METTLTDEKAIAKAAIAGFKSVKTSYAKQQTEVEFNHQKISERQMIEAIKKAGYGASIKQF